MMFAFLSFVDIENSKYIVLAHLLRVNQGIATVLIKVSYLSIVTSFYPSNTELLIGMLTTCTAIGLIMGPLVGAGLYNLGGYTFMFCTFGVVFILLASLGPFIFPPLLDLYTEVAKKELVEKYCEEIGDSSLKA